MMLDGYQGSIERLAREFKDIPEAEIWKHYEHALESYQGARITVYVPILAFRKVRATLRTLQRSETHGRNPR